MPAITHNYQVGARTHFSSAMPKHLLPFEVCEVWGIESRKRPQNSQAFLASFAVNGLI
jgi:hypothetical protein